MITKLNRTQGKTLNTDNKKTIKYLSSQLSLTRLDDYKTKQDTNIKHRQQEDNEVFEVLKQSALSYSGR